MNLGEIKRENALIYSIKRLWNGIWPEERFKLCVFFAISILYSVTFVVIPIFAYFTFILLKFDRTQDLDVLHIMKSRFKRLCVGIAVAAAVAIAYKGVVTKVEIDHSHTELEMINQKLLTLEQEQSTLLQEHKEQYQSMVAERRQSKEIRLSTEVELEKANFNFEQTKIRSAMSEKIDPVRYRQSYVQGEPDRLYYSFWSWSLFAVLIVLFTTLYYITFNLLFLKPLFLSGIRRIEGE